MAYRIITQGVTIEVDTELELLKVLGVLQIRSPQPAQPPLPMQAPADGGTTADRMRRLYSQISPSGNQIAIARLLLGAGREWTLDGNLRASIGVDSNHALAGVLAGIAKKAKKFDLDYGQLFEKQRRNMNGTDELAWWYRATDEFRVAIADE